MNLTYQGDIVADLVRRVLGPDTANGYALVDTATYDPDAGVTIAHCRPVLPDEFAHVVRDQFGQLHLPAQALAATA